MDLNTNPQDQNPASPVSSAVAETPHINTGALIAAAVVGVLIVLGGIYLWMAPSVSQDEIAQEEASMQAEADAQTEALRETSTSDATADIEADLEATDLGDMEAEMNATGEQL